MKKSKHSNTPTQYNNQNIDDVIINTDFEIVLPKLDDDKDYTFNDIEDNNNSNSNSNEINISNELLMDVDSGNKQLDSNDSTSEIASKVVENISSESKNMINAPVCNRNGQTIGQIELNKNLISEIMTSKDKDFILNDNDIVVTSKIKEIPKIKRTFKQFLKESKDAANNKNDENIDTSNIMGKLNTIKNQSNRKAMKLSVPEQSKKTNIKINSWITGQLGRRHELAKNLRINRTFEAQYTLSPFPNNLYADIYTCRRDLKQKDYNDIMEQFMKTPKVIDYNDYYPSVCPHPIKIYGPGIQNMNINYYNKWTFMKSIQNDIRNITSFLTRDNGRIELYGNHIIFIQNKTHGGLLELLDSYSLQVGEKLENIMTFKNLQISLELLGERHIFSHVTLEIHSNPDNVLTIMDIGQYNLKKEVASALNNKLYNIYALSAAQKRISRKNYKNINLSDITQTLRIPVTNETKYELNMEQLPLNDMLITHQAHFDNTINVKIRHNKLTHKLNPLPIDQNNKIEDMINEYIITPNDIIVDDYCNILRGDIDVHVRRIKINNYNKFIAIGVDMDILDTFNLEPNIKVILNSNVLQLSIGDVTLVETCDSINLPNIYKKVLGICALHKELGPLHGSKCPDQIKAQKTQEQQVRIIWKNKSVDEINDHVKNERIKWCWICGESYVFAHKCPGYQRRNINPFDGSKAFPFSLASAAFLSRCATLTTQVACVTLNMQSNQLNNMELLIFSTTDKYKQRFYNITLETMKFIGALSISEEKQDELICDDVKIEINYDIINKRIQRINNFKLDRINLRETVHGININNNENGFIPISQIINKNENEAVFKT